MIWKQNEIGIHVIFNKIVFTYRIVQGVTIEIDTPFLVVANIVMEYVAMAWVENPDSPKIVPGDVFMDAGISTGDTRKSIGIVMK